MRVMEHLQLDPLAVMARAQDLMLHSRVVDYRPDDWATLTYGRRRFFDWGGWLAVRPMDELPYWRVLMRRERESDPWKAFEQEHREAIAEMRTVLRDRGVVANRDFAMSTRRRTDSYRGRKDSALALYYLWRIGEAMIHHRERFERVYAPTESVAPADLIHEVSDSEADAFLWRKQVAADGLTRFLGIGREQRPAAMAWRDAQVVTGALIEITVDGWKGARWALGGDADTLRTIEAGGMPNGWKAIETTTEEEMTFLAPLDPVSARGRAKTLFNFDYKWEVYTPAANRRYGYYTLPVLWGDGLVARFDGKLDRPSGTLRLLGLWLEDEAFGCDQAFAAAFARGMTRFRSFLDAVRIDASGVQWPGLRRILEGSC